MKKLLFILPLIVVGLFLSSGLVLAGANPTISGTITYDNYASGDIIVAFLDGNPGEEGTQVLGYDSFSGPGAYSITFNQSFKGEATIIAWNDVDGNSSPDGKTEATSFGTYEVNGDGTKDLILSFGQGPKPGGDEIQLTGEVIFDEYESGDIIVFLTEVDLLKEISSEENVVSGGDDWMIDMEVLDELGEFTFDIDAEYEGEDIYLFAFNDVNGDEDPSAGEFYGAEEITAEDKGFYEITLEDQFNQDMEGKEDEYDVSGVVEYDDYVSGSVIVLIADCSLLDDKECEGPLDVMTGGLGEYRMYLDEEDAGDIYILAFNDVDGNDKPSEGEAYHEAWIEAEDDIFYNITLGLDGGSGEILDLDRYSIHGILTYDDWDSGVCVVQVYEPGEFEDGEGDEVDYDVLMSGSGEYELSLDLGMHGQIQLFALCDTNDNDELDEGEPVHYVVLTVEDDYEYNFSLDRSWVSGMQPVVVSPLEEEGGFLAVMPAAAGGPNVRVLYEDGSQYSTFFAYNENLRGGFNVLLEDMDNDGEDEVITWTNQGFGPDVRIFTLEGELIDRLMVYDDNFRGGVNLVVGNFDKDENMEFAVAPQNGSSNLRVYDYADQKIELLDWIMVYNLTFKGGMNITTEDFDGDDYDEIAVVPASGGGPNVQVFDYDNKELAVMGVFFAYDKKFHGGVLLESVELDGDVMLVTAPFKHGGPNIRVYKYIGGTFELVDWFMAFDESFRGELSLSSGELDEYDNDEIVIAPKSAGGPNVRIYEYEDETGEYQLLDWFMAYDEDFRGGVNVMCTDIDGDNFDEIVTAPASGAPNVRVYDVDSGEAELNTWFWAFAQSFMGGVNL